MIHFIKLIQFFLLISNNVLYSNEQNERYDENKTNVKIMNEQHLWMNALAVFKSSALIYYSLSHKCIGDFG